MSLNSEKALLNKAYMQKDQIQVYDWHRDRNSIIQKEIADPEMLS